MDIQRVILELKAEKERLDRAIAALEGDLRREKGGRTRKAWGAAARRAAAERMRRYWENRRKVAGGGEAHDSAEAADPQP